MSPRVTPNLLSRASLSALAAEVLPTVSAMRPTPPGVPAANKRAMLPVIPRPVARVSILETIPPMTV
ncbi:MAG: hypothetical protein VW236_08330 [Flavobacteriaceae bacterium]